MEFDTELEEIRVESYSPTLDQYRTADESVCTLPVTFGAYGFPPIVDGGVPRRHQWLFGHPRHSDQRRRTQHQLRRGQTHGNLMMTRQTPFTDK